MNLTLAEYQHLSKRTLPKKSALSIANYALGLCGESGEVADHIKKHVFHGHTLNDREVLGELGDVLHYLSGLATMTGHTLEEVARFNIEKLNKRYPDGFSKESSINREY